MNDPGCVLHLGFALHFDKKGTGNNFFVMYRMYYFDVTAQFPLTNGYCNTGAGIGQARKH